ncbi:MAG: thioredoxin family protein [Salibacteraceae bacterium]
MIKAGRILMVTAMVTALAAFTPPSETVEIGDPIPLAHVQMTNIDGATTMLRSEMKMNGLLVIFSCNTCPFVLQWENRYNPIFELCEKNDVGMVLVTSNEAKRDGDDSMAKMNEKAESEGYKMKYLMDKDHVVADAFGARTTPHVYLFNKHAKLAYRGSIDDNSENPEEVSETYLMDAINNMVLDEPIDPNITKSIGCSIKRIAK